MSFKRIILAPALQNFYQKWLDPIWQQPRYDRAISIGVWGVENKNTPRLQNSVNFFELCAGAIKMLNNHIRSYDIERIVGKRKAGRRAAYKSVDAAVFFERIKAAVETHDRALANQFSFLGASPRRQKMVPTADIEAFFPRQFLGEHLFVGDLGVFKTWRDEPTHEPIKGIERPSKAHSFSFRLVGLHSVSIKGATQKLPIISHLSKCIWKIWCLLPTSGKKNTEIKGKTNGKR